MGTASRLSRDMERFGMDTTEVLERYDFKCQECGMTQEQHIIIFGSRLIIHHIDGMGRTSDNINNDINNLIPLCRRCHAKVHREMEINQRWGDLLEQDNSKWKYPKLRKLVQKEMKKGNGVQEAKRIVSKNTGLGFSSIDHKYYELKDTTFKDGSTSSREEKE